MSKLGCSCGHVIVDQTDALPYKAELLRSDREEQFYEQVEELFASIRIAVAEGRFPALARETSSGWQSAREDEFFIDKLSSITCGLFTAVYECEACGRLWVQRAKDNQFISYVPDSGEPQRVLSSE